jgi:hypothetical protein
LNTGEVIPLTGVCLYRYVNTAVGSVNSEDIESHWIDLMLRTQSKRSNLMQRNYQSAEQSILIF